jgi:hypothetical protein
MAWDGGSVTFNGSFTTSAPGGGAPTRTSFIGEVYGPDGERFPPGTRVEAYVGDVLCGIASTRRTGSYSGYVLNVVASDAVAGCDRGATLTFRIDAKNAVESAINDLGGDSRGHTLDLTLPAR